MRQRGSRSFLRRCRGLTAAVAGACLVAAPAQVASAGRMPARVSAAAPLRFTVTTIAEAHDAHPGSGRCADDNVGGLAVLSFDTFFGNSGSVTGTFYTKATGTIFATAGAAKNCEVPVHETAGFNLATDDSCGMDRPTDLTGVGPRLGPLAHNGGPTSTQALLRASPGVDSGALPATSGCPRFDQRGKPRPWGPACDIGAFELHYRAAR